MQLLKVTFKVTETCNNGNERRIKKSVYMPRLIRADDGSILNRNLNVQIQQAMQELKAKNYYNIQYEGTSTVEVLTVDIKEKV